jgi:hypothetical protein
MSFLSSRDSLALLLVAGGLLALPSIARADELPLVVPATLAPRVDTAPVPPLQPGVAPRHRSRGLWYTGIAVSALGGAATLTGVVLLSFPNNAGGALSPLPFIGLAGVGGGALLGAIGAPLWAVGSASPSAATTGRSLAIPKVTAGPGSVRLDWRF